MIAKELRRAALEAMGLDARQIGEVETFLAEGGDLTMRFRGAMQFSTRPEPEPPEPEPPSGDDFTDLAVWEKTFGEEFAGPLSIWSYWENEPSGTWKTFFYFGDRCLNSNGEKQYYMDEEYAGDGGYNDGDSLGINPFEIDDGALTIWAEQSDPAKAQHYWGYPYTSGLITTEPSFSQTYGRFVAKMQMPKGSGLWPAFWLLPVDKSWPPEIDVVEFFGGPNSRGEGGVTKLHWGGHSMGGAQSYGAWWDAGCDLTAAPHVYACEWDALRVRYFFDDRLIAEEATRPDFHKPMYMLLNLAIGGHWAEDPPAETTFPNPLKIDFVRAYRRRARRYVRELPDLSDAG